MNKSTRIVQDIYVVVTVFEHIHQRRHDSSRKQGISFNNQRLVQTHDLDNMGFYQKATTTTMAQQFDSAILQKQHIAFMIAAFWTRIKQKKVYVDGRRQVET